MASVRLRAANAVLRNLMRIHVNRNVCLTTHRENHILSSRLIYFVNRTSSLTSTRKLNPFRGCCRLEHTNAIPTESVISEKIVSSSTAASTTSNESPKLNAAVNEIENKNISSNVTNTNSNIDESMLPEIPDPPLYSSFLEEPKLSTLGLGGWSPSGMVQHLLEFIHVTFDMPWWACITTLTVIVRTLLFPLSVKSRREMINYQNTMPELQRLQLEMSTARMSGNYYEAARAGQEFARFIQEKAPSPAGIILTTMIQAPVFLSVFFALRRMTSVPEFTSFHTGGLFWFTDLSVPDQFYVLPFLTSLTMWATLKFGVSLRTVPPQFQNFSSSVITQVFQIGIPTIIFLFTMKFPAAILCYWVSSNIFVLCQTFILNMKSVNKYFKIPSTVTQPTSQTKPDKKLGFFEGFRESYTNMKISREIQQREFMNALKFEEIGNKPAKRTFKFNPTKVVKLNETEKK